MAVAYSRGRREAQAELRPLEAIQNHQTIVKIINSGLAFPREWAHLAPMSANHPVLDGEALRLATEPCKAEIGKSDGARRGLVRLAVTEHIRLSDCLRRRSSQEQDAKKAQAALRAFRKPRQRGGDGTGGARAPACASEVELEEAEPGRGALLLVHAGRIPSVKQAERYAEQVTGDVEGKPRVASRRGR